MMTDFLNHLQNNIPVFSLSVILPFVMAYFAKTITEYFDEQEARKVSKQILSRIKD